MTISTYSELQTAVANWLNRTDMTDRIPEFIALAESRLNRDLRLRVMESDQSLTATASSRLVAIPSGFLEPLALFIDRGYGREELVFVPSGMETSTTAGIPQYWTVDSTSIAFERPAADAYSLTLKMLLSFALSDGSPTNWLLTNYPTIYLAASLVEGFSYLLDDAGVKLWVTRAESELDRINTKEARSRSLAMLRTGIPDVLRQGRFDIVRGF